MGYEDGEQSLNNQRDSVALLELIDTISSLEEIHEETCQRLSEMELPDEWRHWSNILVDQIRREVILDMQRERLVLSHAQRLASLVEDTPSSTVSSSQKRMLASIRTEQLVPPPWVEVMLEEEE